MRGKIIKQISNILVKKEDFLNKYMCVFLYTHVFDISKNDRSTAYNGHGKMCLSEESHSQDKEEG